MVVCLAIGFMIGPHVQGEEELKIFTVQVYIYIAYVYLMYSNFVAI